jgi:hypothetical protein
VKNVPINVPHVQVPVLIVRLAVVIEIPTNQHVPVKLATTTSLEARHVHVNMFIFISIECDH